MKVTISKTFDFDAAHFLPNVPADHKCRRLHGHTYRVEIICAGEPDARGMVLDYAELAAAWAPIHDLLDHRCLNDIAGLENPTTEVLAPFVLLKLKASLVSLVAVRVYESSTTWCEARLP
jgi:6-pyruvoyltetrahydropterin/6-carboxytetrahydropterin synthase